jgi:uncharacterized protein (UPF0548 family)
VISPRHPSADAIERYRLDRLDTPSTAEPAPTPLDGFHHDAWSTPLGSGTTIFERAREGIAAWVAQRHSGVEVHPADAPIAEGTVIALVTRQAGAWLLFACRVHLVTDEPHAYGFTYATLPGHPEQGYESFTVRHDPTTDDVTFEIAVVWRPAILLARLIGPVSRVLQRRATEAYLAAMREWVASA